MGSTWQLVVSDDVLVACAPCGNSCIYDDDDEDDVGDDDDGDLTLSHLREISPVVTRQAKQKRWNKTSIRVSCQPFFCSR